MEVYYEFRSSKKEDIENYLAVEIPERIYDLE